MNYDRINYFINFIIIYAIFNIFVYILFNNITLPNKLIIKMIMPNDEHHAIHLPRTSNIINGIVSSISNISINNPTTLLASSLVSVVDISHVNKDIITNIAFEDDYSNMSELEKEGGYIADPNSSKVENPRVYIYNTHQLENYQMNNMAIYNIRPNVMLASYMMKEQLNKLGLPTIVEETNLTEFLRLNSWTYKDSYKASRIPLMDAISKYKSLEYFIDIHRDSPSRETTTLVIDNKTYARILFVVGLENPNYQKNLAFARGLNAAIEAKYPKLSRGILTKKGPGVNGLYNQDISPNMILLEIGGVDNTIEEVANTTEIMAPIIYNYIEGD